MNVKRLRAHAPARTPPLRAEPEAVRHSADGAGRLRKVTDELILSERARADLREMRNRPDLATSIRSRLASEQLTDERVHVVTERIARGFYGQTTVLRHTARTVSTAIAYGP